MLNPFIELIGSALGLYKLAILVWAVIGLLIHFDVVNRYQPLIQKVMYCLDRLIQPALRPIRRFVPMVGGLDLSVIVLILLIQFTQSAMYSYLWNL